MTYPTKDRDDLIREAFEYGIGQGASGKENYLFIFCFGVTSASRSACRGRAA